MELEKNIYQRVAAITAELQTVQKNLDVSTGKGKGYKAVSERDVIDAVKPIEEKHRVFSYPYSREVLESHILESATEYGTKTTFFSRIQTVYRFVNIDNPADYIETTVFSEGIDSQDKGSGKAMTYADKYALLKVYKISTGDDPDQTASEETRYTKRTEKRNEPVPLCANCGTEISVREHDYSWKIWGIPLCRDCQKVVPKK